MIASKQTSTSIVNAEQAITVLGLDPRLLGTA
jgi:hypothetical protein